MIETPSTATNGLVFPGKAGGGKALVIAGTMNTTAPTTTSTAATAVSSQPTSTFTITHSRSRQVAGSCTSQLSRLAKLSFRSPAGSSRYGSAIGTSHHSPASRLVRLASRRIASSVLDPADQPMPKPAPVSSNVSSTRWIPGNPRSAKRTPTPTTVRPTVASKTARSPSSASISPTNASPRAAAVRLATGPSLGRLRCGEIAVTITKPPSPLSVPVQSAGRPPGLSVTLGPEHRVYLGLPR
jgi:hypothetical protein